MKDSRRLSFQIILKLELRTWTLWVSIFSDLSDAGPFILLLLYKPYQHITLRLYFLTSFAIKAATILLLFAFDAKNTQPAYHLLAPLEFIFLAWYYSAVIGWKPRQIILPVMLIVLLNLLNSLFVQKIYVFNSYAWSVNTLMLMGLSFFALYRFYLKAEDVLIEDSGEFIINAGFLLYFAGSLFTYILGLSILSSEAKGFFGNAWIIQATSNLIKNLIAGYGITRINRNE